MRLMLDPELQNRWQNQTAFDEVMQLTGTIYREQPGRRTLSFTHNNQLYFAKIHTGVGWKEIFKNIFMLRKPVLGATPEYLALTKAKKLGIAAPDVVGFGCRGINPATQQSFILTKALNDTLSLEELGEQWQKKPPNFRLKKQLILNVANIARKMHSHGVNHRDFYLCHFLMNKDYLLKGDFAHPPQLAVIDWHRAQTRRQVPKRWLIKDLSGLYFSSLDYNLTQNDYFRFLKIYFAMPLREIFATHFKLLQAIDKRSEILYRKHHAC